MANPKTFLVRMSWGEHEMMNHLADSLELSRSAVCRLALRRLYRQMQTQPSQLCDILQDLAVCSLQTMKKSTKGGK
jgi:hypothetical protein